MGWKPKVFFQVGAACSFFNCATTIVASRSTVTIPSAPGALAPASAHARSRAAARADRMACRPGLRGGFAYPEPSGRAWGRAPTSEMT